jgi:hypothetical protein
MANHVYGGKVAMIAMTNNFDVLFSYYLKFHE